MRDRRDENGFDLNNDGKMDEMELMGQAFVENHKRSRKDRNKDEDKE